MVPASIFIKKKVKLGAGSFNLLTLMLTAVFAIAVFSANVFSDGIGTFAHTPEITLSPNIANCNQDLQTQFTVNINNTGGYGIYNVKIYKAPPNINSLTCGLAPSGWNSLGFQFGLYCEYVTDPQASNTIDVGESLNFTFEASVNQSDCKSTFRITTLDNEAIVTGSGNGTEVNTYRDLRVDCSEPELEKMVGEPNITCGEGEECDYWITNNSIIEFWAFDNETTDKCNTGIDYCKWEVLIDGSDSIYSDRNDTDANETHWPLQFNEDSQHKIIAVCYDKAGNPSNTIVELDKVDGTPPETNKSFNGPKKIENGVEWIDGVTTVTLTSSDPDPTENHCNIGVDKIWYANILSPAEDVCSSPQQRCYPPLRSPYDYPQTAQCINDMQEYCTNNCSFPHEVGVDWACNTFDTWEECVEESIHEQCEYKGFDTRWHLYNGTPIQKDEESCHILQFFAVDDLGNVEGMNTNCFFVDKTPPLLEKDNGNAILDFDRDNFFTQQNPEGEFHWITQNMSIKFTCEDQQPHPSGDVKLCFKVSYDYPQWRYITEQYCNGAENLNEEGYCCRQGIPQEVGPSIDFDFFFEEDSMHNLEYYCEDAVEKKTPVHTQYYKVDSAAPNITKRMFGNWLGQCPPKPDSNDSCYVADNEQSGVDIFVEDQEPIHAVDRVECNYNVWWHNNTAECEEIDDNGRCLVESGLFSEEQRIIFREDSTHDLEITCNDALGNRVEDIETFLVDSTPPMTEKTYGEPFIDNGLYHWINTSTPVIFNSTDNKVGVQNITWRNTLLREVDDEECIAACRQFEGEGDWNEIDGDNGIIFKNEESCHLIEFYAVDKLNNIEYINRQCVFVDNTGPDVVKEVGEPAVKCREGENCDYYITQNTEISLRCVDGGQHPVEHATLFYRDYLENATEIPPYIEEEGSAVVTKKEDSRHVLEAYCVDALGNEGEVDKEIFVVESQSPKIKKTIVGPWYGDCPPENEEDSCYIDGVTNISVEVTDPEPHPVNDVSCRWAYTVDGGDPIFGGQGLGSNFIVHFPEESRHRLIIECRDALGNRVHDEEQFIVDKTPPLTTKRYGEPIIINEETREEWISNNTQIWFSAYDPQPHPSGVNVTWYRNTLVEEQYCRNQELCQRAEGRGEWEPWIGIPKYKNQESCHLIEYYSVDNVNKTEQIKKQCAYVDLSAPEPNKTVGEPKSLWTPGENGDPLSVFYPEETERCWSRENGEIECWKVTLDTPITLDCKETGPHPVGKEKVYFQVDFDGDDITEEYCEEVGGEMQENGYCFVSGAEAPFTIYFNEESEHNLKFYCEDALGNIGPVDEEKFKVEGRQFKIKINKKWNLISVPFVLTDNNITKVFESIADNIDVVWAYEAHNGTAGKWFVYRPGHEDTSNLFEVHPGHGYWILSRDYDELVIGGSLFSPGAVTPPARELEPGWNLIGYYGNEDEEEERLANYDCDDGADGKRAICALDSLVEPVGFGNSPRWSNLQTYCELRNPNQWISVERFDNMAPGAGYWIFLKTSAANPEEDYLYGPSNTCGFFGF